MTDDKRLVRASAIFLRLALAAAFLSSIADRYGLWGPHGAAGVSWGDWPHFLQFVAVLNPYAPKGSIAAIGAVDTVIEATLALGLVVGRKVRVFAYASAVLLAVFAVTMTAALGVEVPLGYGVFTAGAAAMLLGAAAGSR